MSIVFLCPGCQIRLTVGDDRAGDILDCPNCDSRMQVPSPAHTASAPAPSPPAAPIPPRPVASAPKAAIVLATAPRDRDEDEDDRPRRRRRRQRRGFRCPFCGSTERPYRKSKISPGGWVLFAVLLILFFPLCFIGLLITEDSFECYDCGAFIR